MTEAAGSAARPRLGMVGLVVATVAASALWWSAVGQVVSPGRGGSARGIGAPTGLQVQAAAGHGIVGRWTAPVGAPVFSYQVRVVSAGDGRVVATAETWSPSVVVAGGLAVGGIYRLVVASMGAHEAVTSAAVVVLADRAPDPPLQVVAARITGSNGLTVRWTPAVSGVAATGAFVQLYEGADYKGYVRCQAECTTAAFRGLGYAKRYTVHVVPTNAGGEGKATQSNAVDLRSPCPTAPTCVTVDATTAIGPARQRAQGFLNSMYPVGDMVARVRQLRPQSWRGSPVFQQATGTFDWSSWDAAVATGAKTTMLLSNLWHAETATGGGARPPWADWGAYAAWLTTTVKSIEASGHPVSYWEIQNEPGSPTYFSPADWASATVADYLEQFRVAYIAIKAADPAASIIGPSLSHFADYPGQYDPHEPDLVTFLDFAASHGLKLAAVTWHEIDDGLGPNPHDFNGLPQMIEDHVAEARRLIAERPALGSPAVWVNEYGHHMDYAIPGWALGDIAAIERASVDRAGRSCWPEQGPSGLIYDDCSTPTLDSLLAVDGTTPRANYWVYATYAGMTGQLVAAASSDDAISVLATNESESDRVVAMVGRHVGCLPGVNLSCTNGDAASVPPIPVVVGVRVPWAAAPADVTIARVPATWDPVPTPTPIFHGPVGLIGAKVLLTLPSVADGEVYIVTIDRL